LGWEPWLFIHSFMKWNEHDNRSDKLSACTCCMFHVNEMFQEHVNVKFLLVCNYRVLFINIVKQLWNILYVCIYSISEVWPFNMLVCVCCVRACTCILFICGRRLEKYLCAIASVDMLFLPKLMKISFLNQTLLWVMNAHKIYVRWISCSLWNSRLRRCQILFCYLVLNAGYEIYLCNYLTVYAPYICKLYVNWIELGWDHMQWYAWVLSVMNLLFVSIHKLISKPGVQCDLRLIWHFLYDIHVFI
jgi:hypothetical protein